jgi:hypothetical protein
VLAPFARVLIDGDVGYVDGFVVAKSMGSSGQNGGSVQMHGDGYKGTLSNTCSSNLPQPPNPSPPPPNPRPPTMKVIDILCPIAPPPPPLSPPLPPPPLPNSPSKQCNCPENDLRQLSERPKMSLQEWAHAVTEGPLIPTKHWKGRLMKATPGHAKVGVCPESEVSEQMSCVWSLEAVVDGPAVAGWVVGAAGQTRSRRLLHSTAPSEAIYFVG